MSDLIRREGAVEAILGEPMNEARYPSWYASKIKALPSAEAVEVVQCRDCKHYKKINPKAKSGMCYKDIVASAWNDDGFCSRGKRKGGDDE